MNPYENLPTKAFWKLAVADRSMFDISELWDPKFHIRKNQKVVTFGSCFAQHIGNALKNRGFEWLSTELPPYGILEANVKKFNYNIFSARTGNLYTTSLLKQWTEWALGRKSVPEEYWMNDGRFYDPFRPRIEPNGFESAEEMRRSLLQAVDAFKACIEQADYFVFTLGLTESWMNSETGYEYPMCPGTLAGEFDESRHQFVNQNFNQIETSLADAMDMMRELNPRLNFILTVSPVPLTATKSGKHVAVATMASKIDSEGSDRSTLSTDRPYVDYFPSYEIINSAIFKGTFFEPNQRSVNPYGVNFVMDTFFKCLVGKFGAYPDTAVEKPVENAANGDSFEDKHCEEELLEAFAK